MNRSWTDRQPTPGGYSPCQTLDERVSCRAPLSSWEVESREVPLSVRQIAAANPFSSNTMPVGSLTPLYDPPIQGKENCATHQKCLISLFRTSDEHFLFRIHKLRYRVYLQQSIRGGEGREAFHCTRMEGKLTEFPGRKSSSRHASGLRRTLKLDSPTTRRPLRKGGQLRSKSALKQEKRT